MARKVTDRVVERMPWLDPVADIVQKAVGDAVKAGGPPAQQVKDALHGRLLGHPLHPVLVGVPIGAWTTTLVLDVAGTEDAADLSLALGIAGAAAAAPAGLADWSDTDGRDRRIGLLHAMLNIVGLVVNIISLVLRRRGDRRRGMMLSTVAYGVAGISGFLGGELIYSHGVGVSHTAWDAPPEDFTAAQDADKLQEGKPVRGEAGGVPVVLVKRADKVFALDATCTHAGGPLDEGTVDGDTITCPWHGSVFCLRDGSTRRGPATEPAICFETRVRDGKVEVRRAEM